MRAVRCVMEATVTTRALEHTSCMHPQDWHFHVKDNGGKMRAALTLDIG